MTLRFLPWVRRGLASAIETADTFGSLTASTAVPVTVRISSDTGGTAEATADIALLGPGAVTGLDTRAIIRTEPRRHATNVEPDSFAAIEFDHPELPWMFTPASAGVNNRLRPWLILIVVESQEGIDIETGVGPLPRLVIEAPAIPSVELPDLGESWAWAHTQVITETPGASITTNLEHDPDRNLSRILCPRRLHPDRSYVAALVPAFDQGVTTGLGGSDQAVDEVNPAWDHATLGPSISLPLYYHWTFRTGPAGDFESLARQLEPMPLPDGVGSAPMYIGSADPAIRTLTGPAALCTMEGALRSPVAPLPSPVDSGFTADLVDVVDAANAEAVDAVGPPLYAGRHVQRQAVPAARQHPRWLRDLNAEVRHRTAAGLGVQVVRANQEDYVDEAWEQVGEVVAANQLLRIAALARLVMNRLHERHFVDVDPGRLLAMTAGAHRLLRFDETSLKLAHEVSSTPDELTDPALRRALSPQSPHLKLSARLHDVSTDATGGLRLSSAATHGLITQELETTPPGMIDTTVLTQVLGQLPDGVDAATRSLMVDHLRVAVEAERAISGEPIGEFTIRPDLMKVGVATSAHVGLATRIIGLEATTSTFLDLFAPPSPTSEGSIIGYQVLGDGDLPLGRELDPVLADRDGNLSVLRDGKSTPLPTPLAERIRERIGGLIGPRIGDPRIGDPRIRDPRIGGSGGLGRRDDRVPFGDQRRRPSGLPEPAGLSTHTVIQPLLTGGEFVGQYVEAFGKQKIDIPNLVSGPPAPARLDVEAAAAAIADQTNPEPVITARIGIRVRIDGLAIAGRPDLAGALDQVSVVDVWQPTPVSPVLVGPRIRRALYRDLATYDQERFLPGVGQIPENAVTLLATNPAFVEAFLAGANHEFNRELLWRRYPTDARGTAFRSFWANLDGSPDIAAIHTWPFAKRLGSLSAGADEGSIVLLVRGQLLKRYPNTVVYASPATADRKIDPTAEILLPVFTGRLEPDIRFAGFDLTPTQVQAGDGWMFVLQEQPSEPRFGLDVPGDGSLPSFWSDLHWGHAGVEPGGHLQVSSLSTLSLPLSEGGAPVVSIARNSASMAAATFQLPFRAAIHSNEILDNT